MVDGNNGIIELDAIVFVVVFVVVVVATKLLIVVLKRVHLILIITI